MKKYLSKKTLNVFKIGFLFLISIGILPLFSSVSAQSKLDYYKKLFREDYGFVVCEESSPNPLVNGHTSLPCPSNGYVILLTSSTSWQNSLKKFTDENKRVILICDKPYSIQDPVNIVCDKLTAYSRGLENIGGFLKRDGVQGIDLYVIPENLLVSPSGRSTIGKYFKAFKRSDVAPSVSEDTELVVEVIRKIDQVKALLNTTTFETFGLALSMILMVSAFFGPLKYLLRKGKKRFNSTVLKKAALRVKDTIINYRWFVIYELVVLSLMYIPIIITLGVKDGKGINIGYFITYSLDTLKITNLVAYINQGNYFRVFVFFYNFVFSIALVTLIIPSLVNTFVVASSKIGAARLRLKVQKYGTPLMLILAIAGSSFFKISESYTFLIPIIVVLSFTLINNIKFKTFNYKYSSHEKLLFLFLAVLVMFTGFLAKVWKSKEGPSYKEEDLIGINDTVVTLPYSKQIGENTIFKEFFISTPEPVFVDRYLVYFPNRSSVENKNALEFKDSGSFFIQNGALEDMTYAIYVNDELSRTLVSRVPTNFFRVKNFRTGLNQGDANIQITFSCEREDIGINEIKSDFYHLSSSNEIEKMESTLLYFPGCSEVGKPETFTVEFNPPYIDSEYFFMRLVNVSGKDIKDVRIISLDTVVTPTYYSKGKGYSVISSGGLTDSSKTKVTNYIFGESHDLLFNIDLDLEGKFNISQPINELVKQGALKGNTLIWSTKKYIPVRVGF